MFSFEAHVKLLSAFAIVIPTFFLFTLASVRLYFMYNNVLPGWVAFLNRDVQGPYDPLQGLNIRYGETGSHDSSSELILASLYYCYVILKILQGIFLWRATAKKHEKRLLIWIFVCGILTLLGFLLVSPMKRHRLIEVGLAVVYTKVSSIYSIYTLIVVVCLIVKLKHRHILDPPQSVPQNMESRV